MTNSVDDVISGIDPSKGASPPPSFLMNSCKPKYVSNITTLNPTKHKEIRVKSLKIELDT